MNSFERLNDLSENNLLSLSTDQLAGPTSLISLQLDRNQLQCLDSLALNRWPQLESLSLTSNALSSLAELDLAAVPRLRSLRLGDNPWHCDCRLRWLKRLKVANQIRCHRPSLLFGRSLDKISLKQLKCSGLEKRGTTSSSMGGGRRACREVDWCPVGCSCTEASKGQLVVDCHDRQLRTIPPGIPPNTVELRLEQNRLTRLDAHSFGHLPQLIRLDLSKNAIGHLASGAFAGLPQLNSLMLFANNLTDLPPSLFAGLSSLQILLLNGNRLQCLRNGIFDSLGQLRLLSLYDNQIRSIAESTFAPLANSPHLQTLHLARNPLICDCNLQWLAKLLSARPIETSGARCHSPRRMSRKRIATAKIEQFKCVGSEGMVTQGANECRMDRECPQMCQCRGTTLDCSGRQLASPPPGIPRFTTTLLLANNQIARLPANLFEDLPNLHTLDLSANLLTSISPDFFTSYTSSSFSSSSSLLQSLHHLDLRNNSLRRFSILPANSLQTLHLDGNSLGCLRLDQLPSLRRLSIRRNPLLLSIVGPTRQLEQLEIDNVGQQWLCDCQIREFVQLLKRRKQEGKEEGKEEEEGPKCAEPARLKGRQLASLEEFELLCHPTHGGQCSADGHFCPRGCQCHSSSPEGPSSAMLIVHCSNASMPTIPWGIPPDTVELLLDHNWIEQIEPEQFKGLTKLAKLDLSHNRLRHIPSSAFGPLHSLSSLIMANNQIACLAPSTFAGLTNLRLLSLHGNSLALLPESAFSPLLANLSHIALGANPLWCDCQMNWAIRWMRSKFVEPGIARCEGPPSRRHQLLFTAEPVSPCPSSSSSSPPASILAKCLPCLASPCANSAACFPLPEGQFRCQCPPGFHGQLCEHRVDACFGQPCQNGGMCRTNGGMDENAKFGQTKAENDGRFKCHCRGGFTGQRCERDRNECVEEGGNAKCLNGGICRDQLNGFRCDCPPDWFGQFCEHQKNQQFCTSPNCSMEMQTEFGEGNGIELLAAEGEENNRAISRAERAHSESPTNLSTTESSASSSTGDDCPFDYFGPNCSQRRAFRQNGSDSFLSLGQWEAPRVDGQRELTMMFRTKQSAGVLLWLGPVHNFNSSSPFLALELVHGRLRAAIQLGHGHSPPSQMFSLIPVADGRAHSLHLLLNGQRLFLRVDSLPSQSVLNSGPAAAFPPAGPSAALFIAGVPVHVGRFALVHFRLSESSSLRGCFWDIRLGNSNANDPLDLAKFIQPNSTGIGKCEGTENEEESGEKTTKMMRRGRRGRRSRKCTRERRQTGRTKQAEGGGEEGNNNNKCRPIHPVPECAGKCGEIDDVNGDGDDDEFCAPLSIKKRRIQMECLDGSEKWQLVELPKRCGCRKCENKEGRRNAEEKEDILTNVNK